MHIVITGYYKKENLGDDLFEQIADKIFSRKKIKDITSYKIVPIDKLTLFENRINCDRVILFGGEVLNNYFLDKLLELSKIKSTVKFNAIGVSSNQDRMTLINKIQIFESCVFRCKEDYDFFSKYVESEYIPDIVFTMPNRISLYRQKYIGFFLAQPLIYNLGQNKQNEYIDCIIKIIEYWISKNYKIYLFAMCTNGKQSEDDNFINQRILSNISSDKKNHIKSYSNSKKIFEKISKIKFAVCARYHAHILCIINNIPFLSISNTPKVTSLIKENLLEDIIVTSNNYVDKITYILQNYNIIRKKLKKIYKNYNKLSKKYFNQTIYIKDRNYNTFYIDNKMFDEIYNNLVIYYNKHKKENDDTFNTQIIIFFLTKRLENDYSYGLCEKINKPIEKLKNDMYWLFNDLIKNKNLMFYESISNLFKKTYNPYGIINIKYVDQNDYKGLHRSGWQYVVDNLEQFNGSYGILCDLYLDRTFHWNCDEYHSLNLIPYTRNWIGFIHHTCNVEYSSYNTVTMFKNKLFIQSLKYCKGLIVLSDNLKIKVENLLSENRLNVKVYLLRHPTEFVNTNKMFTTKKFILNTNKKIIQIGAWMRIIHAINKLDLGDNPLYLNKYALRGKKMENYYYDDELDSQNSNNIELNELNEINNLTITETNLNNLNNLNNHKTVSRDKINRKIKLNKDVNMLTYLNNDEYDDLLSQNIVFLNLVDASAVNTVIECMVRNTPIIVNKLPALVEILGEKYPLFYDNVYDVKNLLNMNSIDDAYNYLHKLNKAELKIETFINKFKNIIDEINKNIDESFV